MKHISICITLDILKAFGLKSYSMIWYCLHQNIKENALNVWVVLGGMHPTAVMKHSLEHLCYSFSNQSYSRCTATLWESQWESISSSCGDIMPYLSTYQQPQWHESKNHSADWNFWGSCIQIWWWLGQLPAGSSIQDPEATEPFLCLNFCNWN